MIISGCQGTEILELKFSYFKYFPTPCFLSTFQPLPFLTASFLNPESGVYELVAAVGTVSRGYCSNSTVPGTRVPVPGYGTVLYPGTWILVLKYMYPVVYIMILASTYSTVL